MKDTYTFKSVAMRGAIVFAVGVLSVVSVHVASADNYGWNNQYGYWGGDNASFTANAMLSGVHEVPSVSTNAYGNYSSYSSGSTSMRFSLSAFNIEDATAAHLHCARIGMNGPVVVSLFTSASSTNVSGALASSTITNASIAAAGSTCATPIYDVDDLKLAISRGEIYVNVHSIDYPSGEIRGQLQGSGNFGTNTKKCFCYGFMNYECYNGGTNNNGNNDHDDGHSSDGKASSIPSIPSEPSLPSVPDEPEQPQLPEKPAKVKGNHSTFKKTGSSDSSMSSDILSRLRARIGR